MGKPNLGQQALGFFQIALTPGEGYTDQDILQGGISLVTIE